MIGRLGILIHISAGFGDAGFKGCWTLELTCIQPVVIKPNIEICQIYYHTLESVPEKEYDGRYQNSTGVITSKMYEDFKYD